MRIYYPEYYSRFRCIAGACPDSCCKEWAVDVDDTAAAFYRNLEGDLGDQLRQVLQDTEYGTQMVIEDGRCPMWQPDGLCRIQAQLGHEALCKTCREFPRLRHDYGDFAELGLELSCPEAAKMILSCRDSCFLTREAPGDEESDYEAETMSALLDSRKELLELLDKGTLSAPDYLTVLLLRAHQVQEQLDGGEATQLDPPQLLASAKTFLQQFPQKPVSLLDFFQTLEILTDRWKTLLQNPKPRSSWSEAFFALIRYLIQRYWLQAVSDYDIVCRAKLIVVSFLLIRELGGTLLGTAQLYSKEIENDPDNVEAILTAAYEEPSFTDLNLLKLLQK